MATTTNFGWETPDDTDLVKDGALAMRTLGNAIDASLVDLKGGTTGQVLSKNSNTDMDFTWVTTDDADAIQNSIVDAKGDLIAATADNTPARLAVGNNGETLVADSSASTGLRWTATPSAFNPVINGGMDIWQRGTSISISASTAVYTADRWFVNTNANQATTVSRQATGDTTNLPFIQYGMRVQRNSGQTGTTDFYATNLFETVNSVPYAGKTVTLSFYAKAGANFSAASNVLNVYLQTGTGTDQSGTGAWTGQSTIINGTATLTTTYQRFTFTGTIPATATQIKIPIGYTPTGSAGANDWYEITGVQLDVGSVALPFRRSGGTLEGELSLCQRYYYRFTPTAVTRIGVGYVSSATEAIIQFKFPVTMRTAPTALEQSGTAGDYSVANATTTTCNAVPGFNSANTECANVGFGVASGLTTGQAIMARPTGTAGYLGWSAEL